MDLLIVAMPRQKKPVTWVKALTPDGDFGEAPSGYSSDVGLLGPSAAMVQVCDDGSGDSYSVAPHCNAACTGFAFVVTDFKTGMTSRRGVSIEPTSSWSDPR